jgi:hypothetical protein
LLLYGKEEPGEKTRRMSPTRKRQIGAVTIVIALGAFGWAHASDDGDLNRVANGDFETGFLSLSLPVVSHFPLVVNGWGSRGRTPDVIADPELASSGSHALRLTSSPRNPGHLLQDLTLTMTSYRLGISFRAESGSQEIRLLTDWDREEPGMGRSALTLLLTPEGIEITTSAGSWDLMQALEPDRWHELEIIADARQGTHTFSLDGHPVMSLPGVLDAPPRTLVLGESGMGSASSYVYDDIGLTQLAEEELASLRADVLTSFAGSDLASLSARFEAAAATLARGAPKLALHELSAARRLLAATRGDTRRPDTTDIEGTERMLGALDALIALLDS